MLSWNLDSESYFIFPLPHKSLSKPEHYLQGLSIPWCSVSQAAVLILKPRKTKNTSSMTYEAENFNKLTSSSQHNFNSLGPIFPCENSQWPTAGNWSRELRPLPMQIKKEAQKTDPTQFPSPSVPESACLFHNLTKHSSTQSPVLQKKKTEC